MPSRVTIEPIPPSAANREMEVMLYRFARAGYFDVPSAPPRFFYVEWAVMWLLSLLGAVVTWYGRLHESRLLIVVGAVVLALFGLGAVVFYPQQWLQTRRPIVLTLDGIFMPGRKPLYWSDTRQIALARYGRRTYVAIETTASGFRRMLGPHVASLLVRDTREMMGPQLREMTTTTDLSRELTGAISATETWITIPGRTRLTPLRVAQLLTLVRERVTGMIPDPPEPDRPSA